MTRRSVPAVSVVMPVRDGAETIDAALESIRAQTLEAWELVVVDDGSCDDTPALLDAAARRDDRLRLLTTTPRGVVAALIDGCAAARAPLIARMDADDVMHPDRLSEQVAHLAAAPEVGLVASTVRFGGDRHSAAGLAAHVDWSNALCSHAEMHRSRFVDAPVVHPSVTFRTELLRRCGGYRDGGEPEDYELWLRWLAGGVRFAKIRRELLVWNDRPQRLTRTDPRYAIERHATLRCRYLAMDLTARSERRPLWLWGAGRVTRRRFDALAAHGLAPVGFVDIDPQKIGRRIDGRPVIAPDQLPTAADAFVIVGVGVRGAGALIRERLLAQGRAEEIDFLVAG